MPGAATLILVLAFSGTAFAQAPQAATAEQIERAKEIYLPSAPHLGLAKLTGVWSQELEFASGGPRPRCKPPEMPLSAARTPFPR